MLNLAGGKVSEEEKLVMEKKKPTVMSGSDDEGCITSDDEPGEE